MGNRILYYSTNRELNTEKVEGFKGEVTFKEALFMGQAPDNGLFMPNCLPELYKEEILSLKGRPYPEVAFEILKKYLKDDISDEKLREICNDAYTFGIPIEKITGEIYLARMDQGPTASFKDFAAQIMSRLMEELKEENQEITVLVATSGDTGSAIGTAYKGLEGIKVYILYPELEVSEGQRKQLNAIGDNTTTIAIDGKFDDCQRLVKLAFGDSELKSLNLTSANSINIGRILPQIVYYFYSYINMVGEVRPVIFSVPSGNFGNSLGCEIARRMGLPVSPLIIATNENDEFPKFLNSGVYEKVEPSRKCLSNAMNVGNPSNLARYFNLYGGIVDKEGGVHREPDVAKMKKNLYSVSISDEETVKTIKEIYEDYNVLLEPHGAVGVAALMNHYKKTDKPAVCFETAHPSKFPEIIEETLKITPESHPSLVDIDKRVIEPEHLPNDYEAFKEYLLS
ncbi:threonine synthase [candidate division WOR-3 bacterium]|nr:threonine synthase [candidate division WOR-3 bacterium]